MRDPFSGYDQWKTASPYDDDEMPILEGLIPGFPVTCPCCQETAEFYDEESFASFTHGDPIEPNEQGWHCENCDWEQNAVPEDYENDPAKLYRDRLRAMDQRLRDALGNLKENEPSKLEDFNFPEGDFEWKDWEAGDWHVYACGEKDCPVGWHRIAYAWEFSRTDGALSIECRDVDEDGNWDYNDGWSEEEYGCPWKATWAAKQMANEINEFFHGWACYWLHCAWSMSDPLGDASKGPETMRPAEWIEFCLEAAANNIRCLEDGESFRLVPRNCRVEHAEGDWEQFTLVFEGGITPYISEEYTMLPGETDRDAAARICKKFGWDHDSAPNMDLYQAEEAKRRADIS